MPEFPNDIIYAVVQWGHKGERWIITATSNSAGTFELGVCYWKKSLGCPEKISEFPNAIMDFGSQWCSGGHKGERWIITATSNSACANVTRPFVHSWWW